MARIKDLNLLWKRFVSITNGGIPKHLRLKAWIGGWSDRSERGVRWRQDNRKEPGNPYFYWKKDAFRDSLTSWMPLILHARMPC